LDAPIASSKKPYFTLPADHFNWIFVGQISHIIVREKPETTLPFKKEILAGMDKSNKDTNKKSLREGLVTLQNFLRQIT